MGNPICNLPPEEREKIFRRFRGTLTPEEEETARSLFPQYLFFRNEYLDDGYNLSSDPVRLCTCTACGRTFEAVRGNYARGKLHGEPCNCPECGARVEGKAVFKYRYHMPSLTHWIKTAFAYADGDGGLLVEAGDLRRRFTHDDLLGELDWYPKYRYYFRRGAAQMWYEAIMYVSSYPEKVKLNWITKKSIADPFIPQRCGYSWYDGEYRIIGLHAALEASELRYCQIESFYYYQYAADLNAGAAARWMVKYLGWASMLPQIEFAVKMNLGDAVRELIETGKKNARFLDWTASAPARFLRMDKQDAKTFVSAEMSFRDLKTWRETGAGRSFGTYMTLADMVGGVENLSAAGECAKTAGVSLEKAARYIARLIPPCAQYAPPTKRIIQTWKDYLDMAQKLGYDLTEPTVVMPKDLQQRHDTAAELTGELHRLDEMKRYKARRRMLEKKYGFAMDGLRVVIPNSGEEIVREGRTLHHCVGGYAARHIDGTTTILFVRKRRTPGRSFLTVELAEERGKIKIKQIHGYKNEGYALGYREKVDPRTVYAWFLEPWLAWVNAGSKRDKQGEPVLPEKKEKEAETA